MSQIVGTFKKNTNIYLCGIIFALAFALYANTIPHDYSLDDGVVIMDNEFTKKGLAGIKEIFLNDSFKGHYGQQNLVVGGRYRPASLATFAVEYQFLGSNPHVNHFINVLLYAITGVLIYIILSRLLTFSSYCRSQNIPSPLVGEGRGEGKNFPLPLTPSRKGREDFGNALPCKMKWYLSIPFITAILFVAHPIHTEAVANIKGRDELMSFLGALLALLFTLKYLDTKKIVHLFLTFAFFLLALLSKENAITFVAVIPITIYFFTGHRAKEILSATIPLILATALFLVMRQLIIERPADEMLNSLMNNPFLFTPAAEKYATIFYTLGLYLKLLFFPHPLTIDYYPYHIPIVGWSDIRAIIPLFIYLILIIHALKGLKKKVITSYGIIYFLITLSVVSNIFFTVGTFMNERFVYMPSLGFCLIIAFLVAQKLPRYIKNKKAVPIAITSIMVAIIIPYSFKTVSRNLAWKDGFTLYKADVETSSGSAKSNLGYGAILIEKAGRAKNEAEKNEFYEAAIKYLKRAIEIYPQLELGYVFLGHAYSNYNRQFDEAIKYYEKAVAQSPNSSEAYLGLGNLYGQHMGDLDKSISYLEKAVTLRPKSVEALTNLGIAYGLKKNLPKSVQLLEKAISLNPNNADVYHNLGVVYKDLGEDKKSKECFDKAKELKENGKSQ